MTLSLEIKPRVEFINKTYVDILTNPHEFGQYTPANSMKWVRFDAVNLKFVLT